MRGQRRREGVGRWRGKQGVARLCVSERVCACVDAGEEEGEG